MGECSLHLYDFAKRGMSVYGSVCSRIETIMFGRVPTPHAGTTESLCLLVLTMHLSRGFVARVACDSGLLGLQRGPRLPW